MQGEKQGLFRDERNELKFYFVISLDACQLFWIGFSSVEGAITHATVS